MEIECWICHEKFTPGEDEMEELEELTEAKGAECPHCGSFNPIRRSRTKLRYNEERTILSF